MTTSRPILDADFSAIEARIVCWLAGQEDTLDQFTVYDAEQDKKKKIDLDPYRLWAAQIYQIPVSQITKFPQRLVGKESTLACGFGLGPDRFRVAVRKKGYEMPLGMEFKAVKAWRTAHKKVVNYWYDLERAAKCAIVQKNTIFKVRNVSFLHKDIEGTSFLLFKLPSGRKLAYPRPIIRPSRKFEDKQEVAFFGNIKGTKWGMISIWGGTFCQAATQAVAADIMAHGALNAERAGYEIATLIHDQALAYHREGQTVEEFVRLLTELPEWAKNLPLAAEGALVPYYRKD